MIALSERERILKDGRDTELLNRFANYIRAQQREDGFLFSFYQWNPKVDVPKENSIYYPGEALLGLIRWYQIHPRKEDFETILKAANFLVHNRWSWGGVEVQVPPDAWLAQALAELYPLTNNESYKKYVYKIIDIIDREMFTSSKENMDLEGAPINGMFLPSVTPTGARNEALGSAYWMAKNSGEGKKADEIRTMSYRSAKFQINQQFRSANSYFLRKPERAIGGFRFQLDNMNIRIDTVQHNVTGLVQVLKMLEEES